MISEKQPSVGAVVFKRICALVGSWKRDDETKVELVEFRMTALNSVLVETWTWPEKGIEALTLYHMDGEQLMATHYCPLHNQPRLVLQTVNVQTKLIFSFDSATNLVDETLDHCVEFWIELENSRSFMRGETYTESGVQVAVDARYLRVD